jgi:lipid A ethanolaminephosphotransferase
MPDQRTVALPREQIVNGFDNTILYTDTVLSGIIDFLRANQQRYNTGMLYMSDHGESLGENGMYLHGTPYLFAPEAQKHRCDDVVLRQLPAGSRAEPALSGRAQGRAYSHDNLFHSLLGLLGVHTSVYNKQLDMFAPCRQ